MTDMTEQADSPFADLANEVELNPQPIPPGEPVEEAGNDPAAQVELNPQPIPPGEPVERAADGPAANARSDNPGS